MEQGIRSHTHKHIRHLNACGTKVKLYMGDEHYEYFIRGMEENDNYISVVGHTATENRKIWVSPSGRTIRTDCGNGYKPYNCEGALGAIRLNDMQEFYV